MNSHINQGFSLILFLLGLLIALLPLSSAAEEKWKGDWCGNEYGRIVKCYWNDKAGKLEIPEELNVITNFFPDEPRMIDVAKAESGWKQFEADGSVLVSPKNFNGTFDYGIMQINSRHIPEALKRGYDIFTLHGNVAMARVLYDERGLAPWSASKCNWDK